MHDTLTVGIPVMVIILGIFMNRSEVKDLRAEMRNEMRELRAEMMRRFDLVVAECSTSMTTAANSRAESRN